MNVSSYISRLSNAVDNHVIKETVCNTFVNKAIAINTKIPNTCGFVNKIQYDFNN